MNTGTDELGRRDSDELVNDAFLNPVFDATVKQFTRYFRAHLVLCWCLLALVIILILSPLFLYSWSMTERKEWAETIKNVAETLTFLAGTFALVQWVNERRDRATDILFELEEKFEKCGDGKLLIDDDDKYHKEAAKKLNAGVKDNQVYKEMDQLLDFYVLLHGVRYARQVRDAPLSVCFRYWLAYYFHKERTEFRAYVDKFYPTLARWLAEDCKRGLPFFRPRRLFRTKTDEDFITRLERTHLQ